MVANPPSLFRAIFFTTNLNMPSNFFISTSFHVLLTSNIILYLLNILIKAFIEFPTDTSIVKFLTL